MAFRMITDVRGNQHVINSDCIAYLAPAARGGWEEGGRLVMKQGVIAQISQVELDRNEMLLVKEWLERL